MSPDTYVVKIVFFGLSMFVPDKQDSRQVMAVLMPDTRVQQFSSDGCRIPQHEPVLLVRGARVEEVDRRFRKRKLEESLLKYFHYKGIWRLRGFEVGWEAATKEKELFFKPKTSGRFDSWPDSADDAEAFDWVWKGSSDFQSKGVDSSCLTGGPRICPLSSRILITSGEVRTCRFAAVQQPSTPQGHAGHFINGNHRVCQGFQARDPGSGPSMFRRSLPLPVAISVSLEVERGTAFTITARSFDQDEPVEVVRLRPKKGGPIEIWVGNAPFGPHAPESRFCATHDRDRHFELFYLLAARNSTRGKTLLARRRQAPVATGRRMRDLGYEYQPASVCEVPELFSTLGGSYPGTSGVCGTITGTVGHGGSSTGGSGGKRRNVQ
jgi:hypothetical protein